jgi:hypothetical protein
MKEEGGKEERSFDVGTWATDTRERRPKFRLGRIMRRPKQRQRCAELRYSCSATKPNSHFCCRRTTPLKK